MKSTELRDEPVDSEVQPRSDLPGALHEVSNTLTVVLGWLDRARGELQDGVAREAIDVAMTHARLGHLVARRAIGASVEEGSCPRSAVAVARDAVLGVEQEAARKNVRVRLDDGEATDVLLCAAAQSLQVLINLLLNAIAFSPEGGDVVVTLTNRSRNVSFSITDQGPGIPKSRVETLFTAPVSTRPGGAGIGLRHSHALAASHGGELALAGTGPGGSCFELVWPTGDAPSGTLHRAVPPPSIDGMRILVLEDDPAVLTLVELGLEGRGASVAPVTNERELRRAIENGVFDALLVDLSPLEANPRQSLADLRALCPDVPVVIISGSASPDVDSTGIAAWVRKPFEVKELVEALTRIRSAS